MSQSFGGYIGKQELIIQVLQRKTMMKTRVWHDGHQTRSKDALNSSNCNTLERLGCCDGNLKRFARS